MNRVKYLSYNFTIPKKKDIPSIGDYIIKNNITKLTSNLVYSEELFLYLLHNNYKNVLSLNFYVSLTLNKDEHLDDIVEYIIRNRLTYDDIEKYSFEPFILISIINKLLEQTELFLVLSEISENKAMYDSINKNYLIRAMKALYVSPDEIPFIKDDVEYLKYLLQENEPNVFQVGFSDETFYKVGLEEIENYIARNYKNIDIPYFIIKNPDNLRHALYNLNMDYSLVNKIVRQVFRFRNQAAMDIVYEFYLGRMLILEQGTYYKLDKDKLADMIISQRITSIPGDVCQDEYIFNILLDRQYENLLMMNYSLAYYRKNAHKIMDMVLKNPNIHYISDDTSFPNINYTYIIDIVFGSEELLDKKYIPLVGDYLIQNRDFNLSYRWPIFHSSELVKYLIEKDIDFLFEIRFSDKAYEGVPADILHKYYQKHEQAISEELSYSTVLKITNKIDLSKLDPKSVEAIILYTQRKNATYEMKPYTGLSLRICNAIRNKTIEEVSEEFFTELVQIWETLGITTTDIIELFKRYKENPKAYEEEIIKLIRAFCSKKKEDIAKEKMANILSYSVNNYVTFDKEAYYVELKKQKRKELYLAYLKRMLNSGNLSEEITELVTMSDKLHIKDILELFEAIINGEKIYDEPSSYKQGEKLKIVNRLKSNYQKILQQLLDNNRMSANEIIDYLNGKLSYSELKIMFKPKEMEKLHEIRKLCDEAGVVVKYQDSVLIFDSDISLTKEELLTNKEHDEKMKLISKIRQKLNRNMQVVFPIEDIEMDEIEAIKYDKGNIKRKPLLNLSENADAIGKIKRFMRIRANYQSVKHQKTFDRLFVDSGIIYGLAFIDDKIVDQLAEVAKNIEIVIENFNENEINLDNLEHIIRKVSLSLYANKSDIAILGEDIALKIVYDETFITINGDEKQSRQDRIKAAAKYASLASGSIKSSVPFITLKKDDIKIERYHTTEPDILVAGIDTDACFRIFGIDNDFILYTLFSKNGFVLKITNEEGEFIGRVSGFRNGNNVYFNQLRTIYDTHGNPDAIINGHIAKIRSYLEEYARRMIEATKDSEEPIENVMITKSYGYSRCDYLPTVDCSLISKHPMNTTGEEYITWRNNPELTFREREDYFTTDYAFVHNNDSILLLASASGKKELTPDDIKPSNGKPIYERPRKEVIKIIPNKENKEDIKKAIDHINRINAKFIYWGDKSKREEKMLSFEPITSLDDATYIVLGEDFYIYTDAHGNVTKLCLPYDKRAEAEFKKYDEIITKDYAGIKSDSKKTTHN